MVWLENAVDLMICFVCCKIQTTKMNNHGRLKHEHDNRIPITVSELYYRQYELYLYTRVPNVTCPQIK